MNPSTPSFDEIYEIVPGRVFQIYAHARVFRMYVCRILQAGQTPEWQSRYDELVEIGGEQVWKQLLGVPKTAAPSDEASCAQQGLNWLNNYLSV